MATIRPRGRREVDAAQNAPVRCRTRRRRPETRWTSRTAPAVPHRVSAAPRSASIISKMRSAAAIACCRLAFTRLSFFAGPYIETGSMNEVAVYRWSASHSRFRCCRTRWRRPVANRRKQFHERQQTIQRAAVTFMLVLNRCSPAAANRSRLLSSVAKTPWTMLLAVFGADVRTCALADDVSQRARLTGVNQWALRWQGADDAEHRQPRVVIEQQRCKSRPATGSARGRQQFSIPPAAPVPRRW